MTALYLTERRLEEGTMLKLHVLDRIFSSNYGLKNIGLTGNEVQEKYYQQCIDYKLHLSSAMPLFDRLEEV